MINRSNYEAWFLDFAEGNISVEATTYLFEFLDKNPDLKEEFDEVSLVYIEKENLGYKYKKSLKQKIDLDRIEGLDDFEILAINEIEGNISKKESKELKSLILFSDDLKKEYKAFGNTKLKVNNSLTYANKAGLKKNNSIIIPLWIKYASSIAAIGLFILFVSNAINLDIKGDNPLVGPQNIAVSSDEKTINNNTSLLKSITEPHNTEEVLKGQLTTVSVLKYDGLKEKSHKKPNELVKPDNIVINIGETDGNTKYNNTNDYYVNTLINKPQRNTIKLLKFDLPKLIETQVLEYRQSLTKVKQNNNYYDVLSPKQFLIKSVKAKLDIDDKNYDKVNTLKLVSATLKKTKLGKVDFRKSEDSGKKYLAINIRGFGIERSWTSN